MNMQVTEVRIRPANEDFVKSYASICFEDCFLVHDIRVIKGPTGLFISFLRGRSEGGQRDIAFPVDAETRNMIESHTAGVREGGCGKQRTSYQEIVSRLFP
jgi:stage V sporulation protein G